MKRILYILLLVNFSLFAQEKIRQNNSKVDGLIKEGINNYNKSEYMDADKDFRKALSIDPTNGVSSYNLGVTQIAEEKPLEAVHYFSKASKMLVDKSLKNKAYFNEGNIWFHKKKYEKAVEAYKNALRNMPEDEEARYNLALAKELLKKQNKNNKKNNKKNKKDQKKDKKKNDKKKNKDKKNDKKDDKKKNQNKKDKNKEGKDKKEQQKQDQKKGDKGKKKSEKQQPKKMKLTPQQVKQLLVGLKNKEQKTQKKIKARRLKGTGKKKKQDKDW